MQFLHFIVGRLCFLELFLCSKVEHLKQFSELSLTTVLLCVSVWRALDSYRRGNCPGFPLWTFKMSPILMIPVTICWYHRPHSCTDLWPWLICSALALIWFSVINIQHLHTTSMSLAKFNFIAQNPKHFSPRRALAAAQLWQPLSLAPQTGSENLKTLLGKKKKREREA